MFQRRRESVAYATPPSARSGRISPPVPGRRRARSPGRGNCESWHQHNATRYERRVMSAGECLQPLTPSPRRATTVPVAHSLTRTRSMPRTLPAAVLAVLVAATAPAQTPKAQKAAAKNAPKVTPEQQRATADIHQFFRRVTQRLADA